MARAGRVLGLSAAMPLSESARRILLGRVADVLEWLPRARDAAGTEPVHDLRIAVRRLRYGLEFLGMALDSRRMKPRLKRVRALQETLGQVTDRDAFARRLDALGDSMPSDKAREGLEGLRQRLESEREQCCARAREEFNRLEDEAFWPDLIRDLM